ncbi:MAG: alpha/beta hydrolase [Marmoricola sp.]
MPTDSSRDLEIGNAYHRHLAAALCQGLLALADPRARRGDHQGQGHPIAGTGRSVRRTRPSSYNDNSMEVLYAVNCLDHSDSIPTKQVPKHFAEFEKVSPTFGKAFAFSLSTCAEWPVQSGQVTKAMAATGAPPIVVVGTTRDPATPYQWAVNLADELDSGVLISRDGDGHTGYNSNNSCVDDAINAYLVDGEVPKDGLKCAEE